MQTGAIQVVPVPDYREAQAHAKQIGQAATPKALARSRRSGARPPTSCPQNDLAAWFNKWGASFGWRRTASMHEAQDARTAARSS